MKTILVPTDFSEAARVATRFATSLAKKFKSTIILLHVLESVGEGSFNVEGEAAGDGTWEERLFTLRMIQKARKQLKNAVSELVAADVNTKSFLRVGNSFHGIDSIITEQDVDLVIMGTEGSSDVEEMLVGSNTEKVVRRASCPVIAVNSQSRTESVRSIVWSTSLKNEDLNIPVVLRKLMDVDGVTVHLVRINTPGLFIPDTVVRAKLTAFAEKMKLKRFTINVYNDFNEEDGIIRFAAGINADLVALATHGRRGLSHLLNGSIAEDVVNHSRRPVMTYVIGKTSSRKRKVSKAVA